MELSPGVELAWSLAGREALAAQLPEVEPEHFFCALLKFSEMDNDDLTAVATRLSVAKVLVAERDQVQAILKERALNSAHLRHQLRRVLGRGNHQPTEEGLHRSDAARQLFERAARSARQNKAPLDSTYLLQTLLADPTPAMRQVWVESEAKAPRVEAKSASPLLERYAQDMAQLANGGNFDVPAVCAPQVQVLSLVLRSADPTPILLVCAPQVSGLSIVGSAAQAAKAQLHLLRVDYVAMLKDAPDAFLERMAQLLSEAANTEKLALFFDATVQKTRDALRLLAALKPGLVEGGPRLLVAVSTDHYAPVMEAEADQEGEFRTIWLHELTEAGIPTEL